MLQNDEVQGRIRIFLVLWSQSVRSRVRELPGRDNSGRLFDNSRHRLLCFRKE